ncbi:putative bifunctional diguanylate cyclase/phosphodiesterase [Pseudoteredinibacter isoporae]|uniref:putative bifunctional diguanylate cyclase/phosphodiesterase n=1 Tax=Pseudoteredinibacter isoporae TaxID=570281 RepID=UPI003108BCA9
MNLRTRTSILLLPVIALSYALSAWWIYQEERATLIQLEKSKLEQKITALHSSISNYKSFQDAYLMSLLDGDLLAQFLIDTNNIYRSNILQRHMESSLGRFSAAEEPFLSLLVLDEKNEVILHLENSQDPFAEVSPRQMAAAMTLRQDKTISSATGHFDADGHLMLYQSLAIDLRTLQAPILSQIGQAGLMVVALEAKSVSSGLRNLQKTYNADIHFSSETLANKKSALFADMSFMIPLGGPNAVKLSIPGDYFEAPLIELRSRLMLLSIISCLATFLLLQFLVAKFVTAPIARLDLQLDELLSERRSDISYSSSNDEIGRLARKFQSLYTRLLASFNENYRKARMDILTGLPNRMAFNEQARELFDHYDSNRIISVCYIDVDNFKYINDKYGHEVGDRVLGQVAKGLNESVETCFSDHSPHSGAYRLSGDEFVVLAMDANEEQIRDCANSILSLFEGGLTVANASYPVTVSLGVASTQSEHCSLSELMSNVDLAMYQAKKSGKNRIAKYSETLARQHRRMQNIELAIKSPGFEDELHLCYMPIVDRQLRLCSIEVLLRWTSKTLGNVPPDEFIPLAESIGAFAKIDLWVIEQVFKNESTLRESFPMVKYVSINISSAELNSITFVDDLAILAGRYDISSGFFVLEVTETFATGNQEQVHENLNRIRGLGFRIAIDDFGTGYTSVMQMLDYPADAIKFDRSLIKRISQQTNIETAKALVELCKMQGLLVVAEGIETERQSVLFNDIGCSYQQGYFYGQPLSLENLESWLDTHTKQLEESNLIY